MPAQDYIIAFWTPRLHSMQHVVEPNRGRAWVESPYLRSLLVSQLYLAMYSTFTVCLSRARVS
jgi:hypothetical protein